MNFSQVCEKLSENESRNATAKFIDTEVENWRGTRTSIAAKRWLWELIQNARDCAKGHPFCFKVSWKPSELTVWHDAGPFQLSEIVALVEGNSSKQRRSTETTGKFGRGFLVTHVISTDVRVKGILVDRDGGHFGFTFRLSRSGPERAILENIRDCYKKLDGISPVEGGVPGTQFVYTLSPKDRSRNFIEEALRELHQHSIFLFAFIPELTELTVSIDGGTETIYKALSRDSMNLRDHGVNSELIFVQTPTTVRRVFTLAGRSQHTDGEEPGRSSTVAVEIVKREERDELSTPVSSSVAKIFQDLPLYATSDFDIPLVINLPRTADVDSDRSLPNLKKVDTRKAISNGLMFLPILVQLASGKKWGGIHLLGELGIQEQIAKEPDVSDLWLEIIRPVLKRMTEAKIVETPGGNLVRPIDVVFPKARWSSSDPTDRDLLSRTRDLLEMRGDRVPTADSVQDWRIIIDKWKTVEHDCHIEELGLRELFNEISSSKSVRGLSTKHASLGAGDASLRYVCEAFAVVAEYCKRHRITALSDLQNVALIPSQMGTFRLPSELGLDGGVDEILKNLSDDLGIPLRQKLVHTLLTGSSASKLVFELCGGRTTDNRGAIASLITRVEERASQQLRGDEADRTRGAAAKLLVWLASNEGIAADHNLEPFPLVCCDGKFRSFGSMRDIFLLPEQFFPEEERQWLRLFSESIRLSTEYQIACQDFEIEPARVDAFLRRKMLASGTLVFTKVIEVDSQSLVALQSPTSNRGGHRIERLHASCVAGFTRLLSDTAGQVSSKGDLSRIEEILRFILSFLINKDGAWREPVTVQCVSKHAHNCSGSVTLYACEWLGKIKTIPWVPSEEPEAPLEPLSARNIDKFLKKLSAETLQPPVVREFLSMHFGVDRLALAIRAAAGGSDAKESELRDQWAAVVDLASPNDVQDFVNRRAAIREVNRRNYVLGHMVEKLAMDAFDDEGFDVKPNRIGSDFTAADCRGISADLEQHDVGTLKLAATYEGNLVEFLVEVKTTGDDTARMSWIQADTAVQNSDRYVLCVVDLRGKPEIETTLLTVSEPSFELIAGCIRLIPNIGERLETAVLNLTSAVQMSAPGIKVEKADELRFRVLRSLWENGQSLREWAKSVREQVASSRKV